MDSLADIATLTELDLQNEIYPLARALVYSRKAKVVDAIGPGLKNMYVPLRNSRPYVSLFLPFLCVIKSYI